MRRLAAPLALSLLSLLSWFTVMAQETTSGTITGRVTDPTGRGIAGAVIISTSEYGTRTAETDAKGDYILPFLRPGSYTLRAEAPGGFNTAIKNDINVGLNQRIVMNFQLEPGKKETVTVTGEAPLVDPKSTASSTNINYEDFANSVPLGRSFTDTYAVAPGVVSGIGTGQGNYSIGGASGLENSYLIDGVNVTNTGYGGIGAYNIVYGSLGTGVTSEFLDQVQIKTGGFEAEYGQALGGIINTIVKSGTNDFKGSAAWYSTLGRLRSDYTTVDLLTGTSNLVYEDVQDFAVSAGGPIRKDRLFYFVAYNPVFTTQRNEANSIFNPGFEAAQAGNPRFTDPSVGFNVTDPMAFPSSGRELERKRTANTYAAKLTWQANSRNNLELTFFGDPADGDRGFQRDTAPLFTDYATGGGQSRIEYGSNNGTLKWNAVFSPTFFLEAQVGRHVGKFRESSVKNENRYRDLRNNLEFRRGATSYSVDGSSIITAPFTVPLTPVADFQGGVGFISNQDDKSTVYQVKFNNIVGPHEVRWGIEYDDISYLDTGTYTGSSFDINLPVSDDAGDPVDAEDCTTTPGTCVPGSDGLQDTILVPTRGGAQVDVRNGIGGLASVAYDSGNRFRVTRARMGPSLPPTSAREYNAFIQDTYTVNSRLTLKLGLRGTQEIVSGSGRFTLPFATKIIDVGGVPTRIYQPGSSSYNPNRYSFTGNFAPRIGIVWDVLGGGKSRVFLNFGRYFQRVPNDLAVRAFSNEVGVSLQEFSDRALTTPRRGGTTGCVDGVGAPTPCDPLITTFTQGVEPTTVVAGSKLPYEDELSAGYAFEVTPTSSIEVRTIFRKQGRALEDTQVNAIEQIQNFYYGTGYGYPYDPFGGTPATPQSTAFPATVFGPYVLANPGTNKVPQGGLYTFPKPKRDYRALEVIFNRRLTNNWALFANYRLAKLEGNYEGLFRNDNGQSDPNITSLYDFPASPLLESQFSSGPLPSDVRHVVHVYPSFMFPFKLRVGANLTWQTGVPRTSLLAHPIYQNAGEIPGKDPVYAYWADPDFASSGAPCDSTDASPCTLKTSTSLSAALADPENAIQVVFLKSYTPVKRGNLGRTPDVMTLDLHGDYPISFGTKSALSLMLDIFNVTNSQKALVFEDTVELTAGVTDPDYLKAIAYQNPRAYRLAARWTF